MGFAVPAEKIEGRHYINGEWVPSSDNGTFALKSPFNLEKIVDVSEATVEDTNRAVAAAKAAFPAWSALSPEARGAHIAKLAELVEKDAEDLTKLDAIAMGRPVQSGPMLSIHASLAHWAQAGHEAKGETSFNTPGYLNMTFRQALGPVAFIIPWNVPAVMWAKIAPALAAGCTIVVKSSEKAPLSPARLTQLTHEAGFPKGVINLLNGHGTPSGATLASHMDIRAINFTGSTFTGRKIQAAAASSNLKKVILELGGKSPNIIFEDADLQAAVQAQMFSTTFNSGQVCISNSRVYVQDTIADKFKEALVAAFKYPQRGDPLAAETSQGPQVDDVQFEKVKNYLDEASKGKGKLLTGGKAVDASGKGGYFIEPTIYADVAEDEIVQKEEVFGPFVTVNTFKTEEEVLAKANDTEFGLWAAVFTKDLSRAIRVAKAYESGQVGINCTFPAGADMPFGGYKGSGQGREGYGYSLEEYLEVKAVFIKLDDALPA